MQPALLPFTHTRSFILKFSGFSLDSSGFKLAVEMDLAKLLAMLVQLVELRLCLVAGFGMPTESLTLPLNLDSSRDSTLAIHFQCERSIHRFLPNFYEKNLHILAKICHEFQKFT
ncbi:hypothetical protein BpHYR1_012964 [Brachionus plicatilis]|uniref:Uncharacterized protein n=1 Tax=Brachionus plicatilis TaxID=10195 RepID=A0A3M7RBL1_BRAPC|nr:hypothetical protein BpHYR1_012964 [Brachionus plicatilis]